MSFFRPFFEIAGVAVLAAAAAAALAVADAVAVEIVGLVRLQSSRYRRQRDSLRLGGPLGLGNIFQK